MASRMFKAVIVTGTPGTGKTTLAKRLARDLGYSYLDASALKVRAGYDRVRRCRIIPEKALRQRLVLAVMSGKKPLVIDSHMSHILPCRYASVCIVTKCSLRTLRRRLHKRGYSHRKIRENMDAEIFSVCEAEAAEAGHRVITVETTGSYYRKFLAGVKKDLNKTAGMKNCNGST